MLQYVYVTCACRCCLHSRRLFSYLRNRHAQRVLEVGGTRVSGGVLVAVGATGSDMPALSARGQGGRMLSTTTQERLGFTPPSSLEWAETRCCTCSMLQNI
ncbi:hypothetical protein BD309DRAFT_304064 [Dichomitus squalens]|uniref:Uncharacterized protein n=1 Tax=Dichomitus squalens TaxID=114155 RepID=A0A4Q9PY35_9APHY|nr:hypothetical protein BD309DRAFT_304064 [Dichomitus squalens]TBU59519.1 hypothetical protein BD310DRAFT_409108 [Dichomitus squalens]